MSKEQSLPEWAKNHFPTDINETANWKSKTAQHALASKVLAVAHTRIEGAWCAYIDAVPGYDHNAERVGVLRHGSKLGERIALILFPQFEGIPYAL